MTQPLSQDLRFRIARSVVDKGLSRRAAAEKFDVAPSTAIVIVAEFKATGTLAPKKQGGDRRSGRIEAHAEAILALVAATPDITLAEIGARLAHEEDAQYVACLLGHAQLDTTARYMQVATSVIRRVMSPIDRLMPLDAPNTDAP